MKNRFIPVLLFAASTSMFAEDKYINPTDTTKVVDIEEVVVIASPKETGKLRELPSSVSLISQKQMQAHHVTSLKDASVLSPNFYMPDSFLILVRSIAFIEKLSPVFFVTISNWTHRSVSLDLLLALSILILLNVEVAQVPPSPSSLSI